MIGIRFQAEALGIFFIVIYPAQTVGTALLEIKLAEA
jgi:hypothetical protein